MAYRALATCDPAASIQPYSRLGHGARRMGAVQDRAYQERWPGRGPFRTLSRTTVRGLLRRDRAKFEERRPTRRSALRPASRPSIPHWNAAKVWPMTARDVKRAAERALAEGADRLERKGVVGRDVEVGSRRNHRTRACHGTGWRAVGGQGSAAPVWPARRRSSSPGRRPPGWADRIVRHHAVLPLRERSSVVIAPLTSSPVRPPGRRVAIRSANRSAGGRPSRSPATHAGRPRADIEPPSDEANRAGFPHIGARPRRPRPAVSVAEFVEHVRGCSRTRAKRCRDLAGHRA